MEWFQSLLLLVLSFNEYFYEDTRGEKNKFYSFNPYCYWSYLLTEINKFSMNMLVFKVSILIVTGPIF